MRYGGTVIYVDDVEGVLAFYQRAFGIGTAFVDLDVQLPGRRSEGRYQFAGLDVPGGGLQIASHDLGQLLMPTYRRPDGGRPVGVEVAFYCDDVPAAFAHAVAAGATASAEPSTTPWGQTVAYVQSIEGTFVGLCSPLPET